MSFYGVRLLACMWHALVSLGYAHLSTRGRFVLFIARRLRKGNSIILNKTWWICWKRAYNILSSYSTSNVTLFISEAFNVKKKPISTPTTQGKAPACGRPYRFLNYFVTLLSIEFGAVYRTPGFPDIQNPGLMESQINVFLWFQKHGFSKFQTSGLLESWSLGIVNQWMPWFPDSWIFQFLDSWIPGFI